MEGPWKLQPKQLLLQFTNVFLSILLKCLKCDFFKKNLSKTFYNWPASMTI